MAITHVWSTVVKPSGLASFPADAPITISGPESVDVEADVAGGGTSTVFLGSIDNTKIISMAAVSSVTTVYFTTPGQSMNVSKVSLAWNNQMPATSTNPMTTTISKIVVGNLGTVTTTFRASFLLQP
jgi:hypothetical protein